MKDYVTKDSGQRQDYDSGMRRDLQVGKPDFFLAIVPEMPYEEQYLTRIAALYTRGAEKYGRRNWQLANSPEELERFKSSAMRHLVQALAGEDDEDHMAAVFFNLNAAVMVQWKLQHPGEGVQVCDCHNCVKLYGEASRKHITPETPIVERDLEDYKKLYEMKCDMLHSGLWGVVAEEEVDRDTGIDECGAWTELDFCMMEQIMAVKEHPDEAMTYES